MSNPRHTPTTNPASNADAPSNPGAAPPPSYQRPPAEPASPGPVPMDGKGNGVPKEAPEDPAALIVGALFDVQLILREMHPSYFKSDVTHHRERFEKRVAKLKELSLGKA